MLGSLWTTSQVLVAVLAIVISSIAVYACWQFTYWRRRGVYTLPPLFPFGNAKDPLLGRQPFAHFVHDIYLKLSGRPFAGLFMALQPSLLVMEPELIRDVLIRCSPSNFQHHIASPDPERDPVLERNLFMAKGHRWKEMRTALGPSFTSGKMKMIYRLMVATGKNFVQKLDEEAAKPGASVNMKVMTARFTTDAIASCAFGIETDALNDPENELFKVGTKIFERTVRHSIDTMIVFQFPSLVKLTGSVFIVKEVAEFFRHLLWGVVKEREERGIRRGDFLDLLIDLKNKGKIQEDEEERDTGGDHQNNKAYFEGDGFIANAVVFYFAGYETTSTALNFAFFELASNQEIQERLFEEIDSTLNANEGIISYETLNSMRYLDMVVNETLRKYPSLAMLDRYCTEDYQNPKYNLAISKGTYVLIPAYGIHHDPRYYPDPETFDPERFSDDSKSSRSNYCYMPFGGGPRTCIGMRFGLIQIKVGLVTVLSKFRFSLPEELKGMKSPPFDTKSFLTSADDGLLLLINKRI